MRLLRILSAIVCLAAAADAQTAAAGALEGSVVDAAGQRVADAHITLLNSATGERHDAKADSGGAFRFTLLPPGTYRAEFSREGFHTAQLAQLTVNASELATL